MRPWDENGWRSCFICDVLPHLVALFVAAACLFAVYDFARWALAR
jgi:hypothetical protein